MTDLKLMLSLGLPVTLNAEQAKSLCDQLLKLERENEALKAERDELSIKAELQLPAYKDLRESFMEGAFWYERSIETGQIALDREAHKYADEIIKLRKNAGGGEV